MITHPAAIIIALVIIEALILHLAERPSTRFIFSTLPPMFWIYFLPTVASTAGLLPQQSPAYGAVITYCLPASLVLLFISVDLRAILRLGRSALIMMAASSVSIVAGGSLVQILFGRWLPDQIWSGLGALSASWMGGSANMVAVKASLGTPEEIFSLAVIADVIVAYSWMGLVIALAGLQRRFDRWNRSDTVVMEELARRLAPKTSAVKQSPRPHLLLGMLLLAGAGSFAAIVVGGWFPVVEGVISTYTWTVILVTAMGILLSITRARCLEAYGASDLGYALLYLVLMCIGARADLAAISQAPVMILSGGVWVAFHALCLLLTSRVTRAPLFLAATASQANIGGPVSAPIVAAAYQPALAQVGLLLAILGNVSGTYLGILCGLLCRRVS